MTTGGSNEHDGCRCMPPDCRRGTHCDAIALSVMESPWAEVYPSPLAMVNTYNIACPVLAAFMYVCIPTMPSAAQTIPGEAQSLPVIHRAVLPDTPFMSRDIACSCIYLRHTEGISVVHAPCLCFERVHTALVVIHACYKRVKGWENNVVGTHSQQSMHLASHRYSPTLDKHEVFVAFSV